MSYKTILVHVNESRHAEKRIQLAARIAMMDDAHLVGVAAAVAPGGFHLPGMISEGSGALSVYLNFLQERADAALAAFEAYVVDTGVTSYETRTAAEEPGAALNLQARYCDLVVLGQPDPEEAILGYRTRLVEDVILHSGRPVLLVPYAGRFDRIDKRIFVAWDASLEAMHAVTAAIPLLKRADLVQVAVFVSRQGTDQHGEQPGADISLYLARHGVRVETTCHALDLELDIGSAIQSQSDYFNADLIVMGCYGHSRFREIFLGGATRAVLGSMTVPVLMAH
ncbi:universal stress protein [Noviherbaspirillum malthae]|uniref:universal stress protein n=1 Tax=Noviherbaspirillum malthae TaxID=1260987 RepID=UPI00188F2019|nr:universal stress protein [Noviherbaspirillum malthae]